MNFSLNNVKYINMTDLSKIHLSCGRDPDINVPFVLKYWTAVVSW